METFHQNFLVGGTRTNRLAAYAVKKHVLVLGHADGIGVASKNFADFLGTNAVVLAEKFKHSVQFHLKHLDFLLVAHNLYHISTLYNLQARKIPYQKHKVFVAYSEEFLQVFNFNKNSLFGH